MKIVTIAVCLFSTIILSTAQTGSIDGIIFDLDSTNTIPGVSVYLENTTKGAITNGNGYYLISNIPEGKHTIVISSIGYFSLKKEVSVHADDITSVNFNMIEAVSTLSQVTVMTGGNAGIKDVHGSVYYISPKEIQKFSYTDINRTLRAVPGINIQEEDGFGLRPNIGLRGTGVERSSKITIMEDGILMAPAPYSAPAAYYFPTIGRMEAIEILKGSSQIKYGPYTTGGAINLISTQIPNSLQGRINLIGGSFGGRNLHAFIGNKHKNFAYLAETFQYSSNGFKELDNGSDTGFDKKDFLLKFRVNSNDDTKVYQSLTFKAGHATETSNETYLGLTETDFDLNPYRRYSASQSDQMNTEQSQFSLAHSLTLSPAIKINTSVYRTNFKRNWYKLDAVKDSSGVKTGISHILDNPVENEEAFQIITGSSSYNDDALYVKANNRSYFGHGIQSVLSGKLKTGYVKHNLEFGIRYHIDQIDRFQWIDIYAMDEGVMELNEAGEPGTESNRVETAYALATHLQYKLAYGNFSATPGLRFENILLSRIDYGKIDPDRLGTNLSERSNTVAVIIPGIGIDYKFSQYLSVFGGIHKGFAPPDSRPETEPEKSINYEFGMRYHKNSLSGQAVIFLNDYSNLLGTDLAAAGGGGSTDLFNGGKVQTKGLELQISFDVLSLQNKSKFSMPVSVAYTFTDARFQNDFESEFEGWGKVSAGDQFPYMANNQFTAMVGIENNKFSINLSGRYMDEMRTVPGQGAIPDQQKTDSYFILDASANYNLHKNISLFGNLTNLSNQVYVVARRPAGLRPGMPRAFNLGLKARF